MAGVWAKRIEEMTAYVLLKGNAQLREGMHTATDSLAQMVRTAVTETAVVRFDPSVMNPGLDTCRDGAIAVDAAECLNRVLLGHEAHRLIDVQLTSDFEKCRGVIQEAFKSKSMPRRSFVYLAWTPEPEVFYYAGRGGSDARLKLDKHGNLAFSMHQASTLSLMFPGRSRDVNDLEGAVIQLVKSVTGKLPIHNTREEFPPLGAGAAALRRFGAVLAGVGDWIAEPYE